MVIKEQGLVKGTKFIFTKLKRSNIGNILEKKDVYKFYSYLLLPERKSKIISKGDTIRLAWFIPDIGIGSGGHLNIFRFIYLLKKNGIDSDVYVCGGSQWGSSEKVKEIVNKYFFELDSKFFIIDDKFKYTKEYDVALATNWQSAYYVRNFEKCSKKAYFIQDFEPFFYPSGSNYAFAEQTYHFGFYGITAGEWLKEKLSSEYGMVCTSFSFSYDKHLYHFNRKREAEVKRVFFYSRPPTERRGFELGLLALNEFCKKNTYVEIIMAGWDISEYKIPFRHINVGVVKIEDLLDIYSQCDVALILSFTNLSLLPLEVMASGCPVIINEGFNNSWIDKNQDLFIYVKPTVESIVDSLCHVIQGRINTKEIIERAKILLEQSSWESEALKVSTSIESLLEGTEVR